MFRITHIATERSFTTDLRHLARMFADLSDYRVTRTDWVDCAITPPPEECLR